MLAASVYAYAGVPLAAPDGSRVGTLCVGDTAPRAFADDEMRLLCDLGALVERELAAR